MPDPSFSMVEAWPDMIVVMALPLESQGLFERAGAPVLFTGLGKVNAAYALARRLGQYRGRAVHCRAWSTLEPRAAGDSRPERSSPATRSCNETWMSARWVARSARRRSRTSPRALYFRWRSQICRAPLVGPVTRSTRGAHQLACDVVDMEAYALAKVCALEDISFACAKYITDGADHAAANDWQGNLPQAAAGFFSLYRRLVTPQQA